MSKIQKGDLSVIRFLWATKIEKEKLEKIVDDFIGMEDKEIERFNDSISNLENTMKGWDKLDFEEQMKFMGNVSYLLKQIKKKGYTGESWGGLVSRLNVMKDFAEQ